MTTIARRTIRSSPHRTSTQTWTAIVDLLTQGKQNGPRRELLAISGIAASLITDRVPQQAPIVVICDGPRTRIYCLYDEAAVEGSEAQEEHLGFDPLQGAWMVSLPCQEEDLAWVRESLAKHGDKITARDMATGFDVDEADDASTSQSLVLNVKGFIDP